MKTNKTILAAVAFFLLGATAYAQEGRVGVNTSTPKTTLDVNGKTDTSGNLPATDVTGLQAPRLTRAELTAKGNTLYTAAQKGALVYITDVSAGDALSQRVNITTTGYYYFDGTIWNKISTNISQTASWEYHGLKAGTIIQDRSAATDVIYNYADRESTVGAYNSTNGIFTAPYTGTYEIRFSVYWPQALWAINEMYVGNFTQKTVIRAYEYAGTCRQYYGLTASKNVSITANAGDKLKFFISGMAYDDASCATISTSFSNIVDHVDINHIVGIIGDFSTMGTTGTNITFSGVGDLSIIYKGN